MLNHFVGIKCNRDGLLEPIGLIISMIKRVDFRFNVSFFFFTFSVQERMFQYIKINLIF